MLSEKDTDVVTGSRPHKILQYGSRHTIQNTGWTTRLSCDPSSRRNSHLPIAAKSQKPVYAQLPFISISKPTVLTLQSSTPVVSSVAASCAVSSVSVLQTMLTQPHVSTSTMPNSNPSTLNHAVLTMPTVNNNTAGKPTTVCFIPVSSVLCGPGLPTDTRVMENVPSTFAVPQEPGFVGVNKTLMPNAQAPGLQLLTVKVHIDNGHITEVTEVAPKQHESLTSRGVLVMDMNAGVLVSGTALAGQKLIDHADASGAEFGYHSYIDGTRVRIAKDTSGQRHAPFFLLPQYDDLHSLNFEECTVEITTSTNTEPQVVPQEADVSEVGTVFTYEPFYVSEQTLTPVPRKEVRSHDMAVSLSEDESHYYYRCYLCAFISDDHEKVCRHWVNVHLTELPYRCPFCDRTFFTSTKAQVHVQHQHKESGSTTVAFQQSSYFANPLSYELGETDTDDDSDSDDEEVGHQIVLGNCGQQARKNVAFACNSCRFQSRSSVVMRQHVKFVHRNGRYFRLLPHVAQQREEQVTNTQSSGSSNVLRAEIAWSNISEKVIDGGEYQFRCRWCSFQAKNVSEISSHVLREHHWPAAVLCPSCSCNVQLTDDDRKSTTVVCFSCEATILLAPSTDSFTSADRQDMIKIYMCNICAFKTRGKGSMCQHIKYNHTKCRPYACVYCNYVAVECSQVKMHIRISHPEHSVIVKERTEAIEQFRHILQNLFPKLVSVTTSETVGLRVTEDNGGGGGGGGGGAESSGEPVLSTDVDSPYFTCNSCKFETPSLEQLIHHQHQFHQSTLAANAAMIPASQDKQSLEASVPGEHFKCIVCGYCCLDRSCMSRHVKYMHITARPHSCIYCSYNNVEKTKVRLHVMAHHPGLPKTVRTDHKILDEMSVQAKHFYVRIDDKGQVVDEGNAIINQNGSSVLGRPSAASPSSSDSDLRDDFLTDEHSQQHDVCTNNDESGLVKEEGDTCDVDDDVDLTFYPRRNRVEGASSGSAVVTLDHAYFRIPTFDDLTADLQSLDDNVVIKQEPLDFDYEDGVSGRLCSDMQSTNGANPEVKTETASDLYSAAVDSLDSSDMSDSENDDFYYSGQSDESDIFDDEYASESESFSDADEPARKKIRVSFGVDSTADNSATVDSIVIDAAVWQDPKMHMTPVVELEDVLQIILAWQQNAGETNDIM